MAGYPDEQLVEFEADATQHHMDSWDRFLKRLEAREKLAAQLQASKEDKPKEQ